MSEKPAIIIVQGSWHKAKAFTPIVARLRAAGYPAEHVELRSVGSEETPPPGLAEDVAVIRAMIERFKEAGQKVIVLCHSSGGVSGSIAVAGFDNITGIIYMTAFMIPKGKSLSQIGAGPPQPWMDVQGDRVYIRNDAASQTASASMGDENLETLRKEITYTSAALFDGVSSFEPWSEGVPCAYLFCSEDNVLPLESQQNMASQLGPDAVTETVKSGHAPFLTASEELVAAIHKIEVKLGQQAAKR
ncbi:alpha/beta-hydrolase [Xylariomycetidae sp. FL2044]|nr:alpha/beta-hydrolase [Xylariomycetidae sp. FL2044]